MTSADRQAQGMIRVEVEYAPHDPKRTENFWEWFMDQALKKAAAKKERQDDEAA